MGINIRLKEYFLFSDTLNTFFKFTIIWCGSLPQLDGLHFLINSKGYFICSIPQRGLLQLYRITPAVQDYSSCKDYSSCTGLPQLYRITPVVQDYSSCTGLLQLYRITPVVQDYSSCTGLLQLCSQAGFLSFYFMVFFHMLMPYNRK